MWHRVWIRKRVLATRTTYCICWYGSDGRQRSKRVGTDRRLAQDLCRRKEIELNSGLAGEPVPISYEAFMQEHLELAEGQVAPATVASQRQALERLKECASPQRLNDVDRRIVEKFMATRRKQVKPATVNKDLRTLRAIFAKAAERGYLEGNPFAGVKKLREPEWVLRVLSLAEIEKLLRAAHSMRWKAFIYLALTTGMRRGELTHLEWDDVDLELGVVTVSNKASWQTKSGRMRQLALTPTATELLEELRLTSKGSMVFQTQDGGPMRNNINKDFDRIVKKAAIKRCTIHDLRRTFCSHLAMAGANQAVVQQLAGHASISTTLKHTRTYCPTRCVARSRACPTLRLVSEC